MTKKKRTYNQNLICARRTYTFKELAEVYAVHIRTIQSWRKEGLRVLDTTIKPYYILGKEIIRFLKEKQQKRKHPLKPGEFYCTTCQIPRRSHTDKLSIKITDKRLGKTTRQAFIQGLCEVCGQRLILFSSERKIQEMREAGLLIVEDKTVLFDNNNNSLNTDILRGQKDEN